MTTKRFYSIHDMSQLLGKSVASIYSHIHRRQFDAVPRPMKMGRRLAWSVEIFEEWVKHKNLEVHLEKEQQLELLRQQRKPGRPTKAETKLRRGYV